MESSKPIEVHAGKAVKIRRATAFDAPGLAKLRYDFRSVLAAVCESESEFSLRCQRWMEERLRQENVWQCWVAELDGALFGNVWLQTIEKVPNPVEEPEHHAYLTNFYVAESVRGNGIGTMLISAALAWCRDRQVHSVILWPTERSRSIYLRHGFSVRDDLLELLITEVETL